MMSRRSRSRSRDRNEPLKIVIGKVERDTEIYIPDEHVGRVIGKGGFNLERVRDETKCFIRVEQSSMHDGTRRIRIRGLIGATEIAEALLKYALPTSPDKATVKKEIWVPEEAIGRVIGKRGSMLDRFRRQFHVDVKVDRDKPLDCYNQREVALTGPDNGVETTLKIIYGLAKDQESAAIWATSNAAYAPPSLVDGGAATAMKQPSMMGSRGLSMVEGLSTSDAVTSPIPSIINPSVLGGLQGTTGATVAPRPTLPSTGQTGNIPKPVSRGSETKTLSVPAHYIGAVIGPKGQSINMIRSKSGCQVNVRHDSVMRDTGKDAVLEVGPGSSEQIQMVERLLQDRVNEIAVFEHQQSQRRI